MLMEVSSTHIACLNYYFTTHKHFEQGAISGPCRNIDLQGCAPSGVALRCPCSEKRAICPPGAQGAGLCFVLRTSQVALSSRHDCLYSCSGGRRPRRTRCITAGDAADTTDSVHHTDKRRAH